MWAQGLRNLGPRSLSGRMALVLAIVAGVVGGVLGIIPVKSQVLSVAAPRSPESVDVGQPWAPLWDSVPTQVVPLSAQNIAPPLGGGTVESVTARALHDDRRIYLLLEWADDEPNDTVVGVEDFSDAAAVQFPAMGNASATPFTMGAPGLPVNIWQWKAVWQSDLASGFETGADRYPNSGTDYYPDRESTLNRPAEYVGNPVAERVHASPIENLTAESFGTLTHAEEQNVEGAGEWRDGKWRALFARDLATGIDGSAGFAVGESTMIAFAVWDGGAGDRNGLKSIAPFIEISLFDDAAPVVSPPSTQVPPVALPIAPADDSGLGVLWVLATLGLLAILMAAGLAVAYRMAKASLPH